MKIVFPPSVIEVAAKSAYDDQASAQDKDWSELDGFTQASYMEIQSDALTAAFAEMERCGMAKITEPTPSTYDDDGVLDWAGLPGRIIIKLDRGRDGSEQSKR